MCCCCCPPAISALFYLWVRSGFSKGSVAGALTFFPPDPPHYKFQRVGKDGKALPDDNDNEEEEDDDAAAAMRTSGQDDDDDDDSDLGTFEINTKSSHPTTTTTNRQNADDNPNANEAARTKKQRQKQQRAAAASQDPIVAMTKRSKKLRARAKHRAAIDAADSKIGISYYFLPNEAIVGKLPSFHGTIHPIKIGPQKKTGTYIAALLYKLPSPECNSNTKTILYSHGNATDIGAMASLQCVIAKNVKCHVLVYDYSGYGESGGIPMEKNTYRARRGTEKGAWGDEEEFLGAVGPRMMHPSLGASSPVSDALWRKTTADGTDVSPRVSEDDISIGGWDFDRRVGYRSSSLSSSRCPLSIRTPKVPIYLQTPYNLLAGR